MTAFVSGLVGLLLLQLLLLSSPLTLAQPFDLTQVSILSLTSDGSCTDTYPTVSNCLLPSTLSLTLSSPIPSTASLYLLLDSGDQDADGSLSISATNRSLATATVRMTGYALAMMGRSLSLYLYDQTSGNRSIPLVGGISLVTFPMPTLTSISGCQGSGQATFLCTPGLDVWTFGGSGFLFFRAVQNYQLSIGSSSGWVYPSSTNPGLVVVNDSYAWMAINGSYQAVLQPIHLTGQLFPLTFNLPYYSSLQRRNIQLPIPSSVSVSFGPMPPPVIRSFSVQSAFFDGAASCSPRSFVAPFDGTEAFTGCPPGVTLLWISGDFMWFDTLALTRADSAVSWPCVTPTSTLSVSNTLCYLPMIEGDKPGQAWDFTLSTPSGSLTFPGLISFNSAPSIGGMRLCRPVGGTSIFSSYCLPGQVLTVVGSGFPTPFDADTAVVIGGPATQSTVMCAPVVQVDLNSLTCTLPSLNASLASALYGQYNSVRVRFPSSGLTTNSISGFTLSYPNSPVLTAVSGCSASNGTLALTGCRPGDVVTITGRLLNSSSLANTYIAWFDSVGGGYIYCTPLAATDSSLQCRLPYLTQDTSSIQEGQLLTFLLEATAQPDTGRIFGSQPFQMTFTWQPPPTPKQTAASNTTAVVAGVLVPLLVLALCVLALLWYRRARKPPSPRSSDAGGDMQQSGGWSHHFGAVELE